MHWTNEEKRSHEVGIYVILCEGGMQQYIGEKGTGEAMTYIKSMNARSALEML